MWRVWNGFLLRRAKKEDVPVNSVAKDGDGHLFWECINLYCMFGNSLSFQVLWLLIGVSGHGACFGMDGYLVFAATVTGALGPLLLVSWLA